LFPTVVATLALGLSVVLLVKVTHLEGELKRTRAPIRVSERSLPSAEADDPFASVAGELPLRATLEEAPGAERSTPGAPRPQAQERTLEEKVADVERQLQAMRSERGHKWPLPQRFAGTVGELSKQLSLSPTQRARIEDAIDRGKQRIEDVLKIPDETGKSPYERREEARKKLEESMKNPEPGPVLAFMTDAFAYRGRKIPGRGDTYGDEIDRIKKETREEIASALDADQRESFAQTNIDPMLGGGGRQISIVSSLATGPDEESGAGIVVEMGATMTDEEPAPSQAEPQPQPADAGGD